MSILLESQLDSDIFGKVPELQDAVEEFSKKQALSLLATFGNIFLKHSMIQNYGLVIVHRHFGMQLDEILVETVKEDHSMSVALPWAVKGGRVSPSDQEFWKTFDLKAKPYVIPQTWSFSKCGNLQAFEFLSTDKNLPPPPAPFVIELYKALKKVDLDGIVGLRRIENMRGRSSWETTPEGSKANIVKFGPMPEEISINNMIRILWYFNSQGLLHESGAFCFFCNHTCNHCNHCTTCTK